MTQSSKKPKVSIVVTIVDGGRYLRDFLHAVMAMKDAPPLEIIVPYDASIADTKLLATEFPHIGFWTWASSCRPAHFNLRAANTSYTIGGGPSVLRLGIRRHRRDA